MFFTLYLLVKNGKWVGIDNLDFGEVAKLTNYNVQEIESPIL
jgi:hypothetical protein